MPGKTEGKDPEMTGTERPGRRILLERNGIQTYMDLEDYLPGVMVCQITREYSEEMLKCQAVIARTYILRLMDGRGEIREEELDLDYLGENQASPLWNVETTARYLKRCRSAAEATRGVSMQYEGREILPMFHRINTGRTRNGGELYPYLGETESRGDKEADDYLYSRSWSTEEFARLINQIPDGTPVLADQLPGQMQVVKKDPAGYVEQMKIGAKTYTGEEIQYALGLPSAAFSFRSTDGAIQATGKGIGHGYGLSQAGAEAMAAEGQDWKTILSYYYKNISLISE